MSSSKQGPDYSSGQVDQPIEESFITKIEQAVQDRDFLKAENLRDKLLEAAPMAISEAIKAAELIEQAMAAAIDKDHLKLWSDLYLSLSQEEKNCLFHNLKKYQLPENRVLLQYGALNNRLFFIEKGEVVVASPQEESKKLKAFAKLGAGDVLGEYSFATIALCSATAVTKTPVQLRCLEGVTAESWTEKHPGLYEEVLDFCKKHGRIDKITKRKEQEVHPNPRYGAKGLVKASLLDEQGEKDDLILNGELEEVSRSGCSFAVYYNQKDTIKKLLTRSFYLDFTLDSKGKEIVFSTVGRVVRVTVLLHNDYLIHIGFQSRLPSELDDRLAP